MAKDRSLAEKARGIPEQARELSRQVPPVTGKASPAARRAREEAGEADRDYSHTVARAACEIIRACLGGEKERWEYIGRFDLITPEMRALAASAPGPEQQRWIREMFSGGGQARDGLALKALESVFVKCNIRSTGPRQARVVGDLAADPLGSHAMGPTDCRPYCGPL